VIVASWWGAAPFRRPRDLPRQQSHSTCTLTQLAKAASFLFVALSTIEGETNARSELRRMLSDSTGQVMNRRQQAVHSLEAKLSSHALSSGKAAGKRPFAPGLRREGISSSSSRDLIAASLVVGA
jgi:hypothetical protein